MYEVIQQSLQSPFSVPIVSLVCVFATVTAVLVAREVRKAVTHRMDLEAKREMLEQGLPAEEIERVLRARSDETDAN